jgi:hypothetical protein
MAGVHHPFSVVRKPAADGVDIRPPVSRWGRKGTLEHRLHRTGLVAAVHDVITVLVVLW